MVVMWGSGRSPDMTAVEQSIRAAVGESEGRTTRAIGELRDDLNTWRHDFMPVQRIEDRWKRDDARLKEHDRQLDELTRAQTAVERSLQATATKDDVSQAVKDATAGFATKADVESIVGNIHKLRLTAWEQVSFIALGVLGFLTTTGIIHPLSLFTGK